MAMFFAFLSFAFFSCPACGALRAGICAGCEVDETGAGAAVDIVCKALNFLGRRGGRGQRDNVQGRERSKDRFSCLSMQLTLWESRRPDRTR